MEGMFFVYSAKDVVKEEGTCCFSVVSVIGYGSTVWVDA